MATRTPLFVAPAAKSKARVVLRKAANTSADTTVAASDQSSPTLDMITVVSDQPTLAPPPTADAPTLLVGADMVNASEGPLPSSTTKKIKDKGPVVVHLTDEPLGKRAKSSVIRSWADAINAGHRDPISATDYLYGLVPSGFNCRDMSPSKLGEESIHFLLIVSSDVQPLLSTRLTF